MQKLSLPVSIIIAGVIIAGAVIFTQRTPATPEEIPKQKAEIAINPVDGKDHILGSPNADIVMIEFSDTACPFCKDFHVTMKRLMEEYGKVGKVAWVYRHFPVHAQAGKEAEATECATELGGNDGFWKFTNKLYEVTPSQDPDPVKRKLDPKELSKIAEQVGLNKTAFQTCLDSGKYTTEVQKDYQDAVKAGEGQDRLGTPFTVVISKGQKAAIVGAQPFNIVKSIIDSILSETPRN